MLGSFFVMTLYVMRISILALPHKGVGLLRYKHGRRAFRSDFAKSESLQDYQSLTLGVALSAESAKSLALCGGRVSADTKYLRLLVVLVLTHTASLSKPSEESNAPIGRRPVGF